MTAPLDTDFLDEQAPLIAKAMDAVEDIFTPRSDRTWASEVTVAAMIMAQVHHRGEHSQELVAAAFQAAITGAFAAIREREKEDQSDV